jgi:hypothetical protein
VTIGLELAWSLGYRKLILESDPVLAVDYLLKDHVVPNATYALKSTSKDLIYSEWEV